MTTQASPAGLNPRSRWIAGIATVTMFPSSTVISMPEHSTSSAARRLSFPRVSRTVTGAADLAMVIPLQRCMTCNGVHRG
ncbi:hypothetical protein GCM10023237_11170 [Streptomyces coeruleoprunus]